MRLYSRYIFRKTFIGFASSISILISLIWFSRAISFVRYITENGIAIHQFFYLFILILPWLLLFIIPISLLASILIVYNRMITSNEMAILKNSGLTKISLSKPAIHLTLICTVICFTISFYFMPYANKKLRLSRNDLTNNYTNLSINPQTFESLKSLTIYVKNRDDENRLFGILLHDERTQGYSTTITAETGHIESQNNSALLYMEKGTVQKFNYNNQKSEILHFDDYVFNLTDGENSQGKMYWKSKERYLNELINHEPDIPDYDILRFRTEVHQRFTYPLLPLIFAVVSLACIMRGTFNRRGNLGNILLAIGLSTLFLILITSIYNMMEYSPKFTPLLYINILFFFGASIYSLHERTNKSHTSTAKK